MHVPQPATIGVAFLHPVLDALKDRGCPDSELSLQLGLPVEQLFDGSLALPANQVYRFLGWGTAFASDPFFCAHLGQHMARGGWAPLVPLLSEGGSVGDFISKFSLLSAQQGPAAKYRLEVEGAVALLRLSRPPGTNAASRYADAMAVAFFVEILRMAGSATWDSGAVVAVLPDPALIPEALLPATSVLAGGKGMNLRFPTDNLTHTMPQVAPDAKLPPLIVPSLQRTELLERVRQIIEVRISQKKLGPDQIAEALGLPKWKLQARLGEHGTSVSALREEVRRKVALERLAGSPDSVSAIATDLGYSDSSNFARAFRGWTGSSPSAFRSQQCAPG